MVGAHEERANLSVPEMRTLISYFACRVPAGFPSPAADYMEERIDINKVLVRHPLSTFLIECEGDSMKDAFIPPKAKLLIDRSLRPRNGDIVLAVLDGDFTVKYFRNDETGCWLIPANEKFSPVEIGDRQLEIWGVVISIIIDPNDVRCLH